jgi:hypothetical protein
MESEIASGPTLVEPTNGQGDDASWTTQLMTMFASIFQVFRHQIPYAFRSKVGWVYEGPLSPQTIDQQVQSVLHYLNAKSNVLKLHSMLGMDRPASQQSESFSNRVRAWVEESIRYPRLTLLKWWKRSQDVQRSTTPDLLALLNQFQMMGPNETRADAETSLRMLSAIDTSETSSPTTTTESKSFVSDGSRTDDDMVDRSGANDRAFDLNVLRSNVRDALRSIRGKESYMGLGKVWTDDQMAVHWSVLKQFCHRMHWKSFQPNDALLLLRDWLQDPLTTEAKLYTPSSTIASSPSWKTLEHTIARLIMDHILVKTILTCGFRPQRNGDDDALYTMLQLLWTRIVKHKLITDTMDSSRFNETTRLGGTRGGAQSIWDQLVQQGLMNTEDTIETLDSATPEPSKPPKPISIRPRRAPATTSSVIESNTMMRKAPQAGATSSTRARGRLRNTTNPSNSIVIPDLAPRRPRRQPQPKSRPVRVHRRSGQLGSIPMTLVMTNAMKQRISTSNLEKRRQSLPSTTHYFRGAYFRNNGTFVPATWSKIPSSR